MLYENATVIICSSQDASIANALKELEADSNIPRGRAHAIKCDCSSKTDRAELLQFVTDKFGRVDVLFLNHGIMTHEGNQMEITEEQYDQMLNFNLKSIFFMIQSYLPLMKKSPSANILVTSSICGITPAYLVGVYGITKAAINSMVRCLSEEFRPLNIRVNAIAPGLISTEMTATLIQQNPHLQGISGLPDQIASVAAMICSSDGSFVNGEIYAVHGGYPKI